MHAQPKDTGIFIVPQRVDKDSIWYIMGIRDMFFKKQTSEVSLVMNQKTGLESWFLFFSFTFHFWFSVPLDLIAMNWGTPVIISSTIYNYLLKTMYLKDNSG